MGEYGVIADHRGESCVIVRRCTTSQPSGVLAQCLGGFWSCSKTGCDSRYCTVTYDYRATSYNVVRQFHLSHLILLIKYVTRPSHDVVSWLCDIVRPSYVMTTNIQYTYETVNYYELETKACNPGVTLIDT